MTARQPRRRWGPLASWQVTLGVALLALGFLIAAQLQSEAPRVRYSTQERPPLVETARDLQNVQDALKARNLELQAEIEAIRESTAGNDALIGALNDQLRATREAAGLVGLVGPGIVIQLADSDSIPQDQATGDYLVTADDIRDVVNELWLAGAEAISVNGERVAGTTGFTDIGTSVLINGAYLQAPYQISALGPGGIEERLTAAPGFTGFIAARVDPFGLGVGIARPAEVTIPAYAGTVELVEARPTVAPSISPSPAPSISAPPSPSGSPSPTGPVPSGPS